MNNTEEDREARKGEHLRCKKESSIERVSEKEIDREGYKIKEKIVSKQREGERERMK